MLKALLTAVLIAGVFGAFTAFAEDIPPSYSISPDRGRVCWDGISNGDTVQLAGVLLPDGHAPYQNGWKYRVEVTGTTTGLDFTLQTGEDTGVMENVDTGYFTSGARFADGTSTGNFATACLTDGWEADLNFTSSGTGDAKVCLNPVGPC